MNVSDDNTDDKDYRLSKEEEDDDEDEGRDDVLVGNLDPVADIAMPPHQQSINVPKSRPSTGTPSSSET